MFLWFVMSIQDAAKLEPAPMTQEIRLRWNNLADLRRRYSIINSARGDCIFNVTFVDDKPKEQYFINFEFFVSLNKLREYTPPLEIYHTGLVPTTQMKDQRSKVMSRAHMVILKEFTGCIWVRVSKILGSHTYHAIFMS
jgi:hypothetical protein